MKKLFSAIALTALVAACRSTSPDVADTSAAPDASACCTEEAPCCEHAEACCTEEVEIEAMVCPVTGKVSN